MKTFFAEHMSPRAKHSRVAAIFIEQSRKLSIQVKFNASKLVHTKVKRRPSGSVGCMAGDQWVHAREPLYSKVAVIAWWLQSTSAQNSARSCLKG